MIKPHNYERFTAKDGQEEFHLAQRYAPGTESLFVYINGVAQRPGDDFKEVSEDTIQVTTPCYDGDDILVSHLKQLTPGIRIGTGDIVGTKATALFKRYSGEKRLLGNQKYSVIIHVVGKTKEYSFTSAYDPYYATARAVQNDLMNVLDGVSDSVVDFSIWENSKLVHEIAKIDVVDKAGKPVNAARQWVRYKSCLDIINAVYLGIATNAGSIEKSLGEMSISKSIKIPYLKDLIGELQKKLDKEESTLTGVKSLGRAMVKAGKAYPYPISGRRSF